MKLSIVVPTYCEEDCIAEHHRQCLEAFGTLRKSYYPNLQLEYLVIDNASTDKTVDILLALKKDHPHIRILVNDKNYGPVKSPYCGLISATGDFVILIAADLQEPPSLITRMLPCIQEGFDAVLCVKSQSSESFMMWILRGLYYRLLTTFGATSSSARYSGFGCYSRDLVNRLSQVSHVEPSLRAIIPRFANKTITIKYTHRARKGGTTSYNLYEYAREAAKTITRTSLVIPKIAAKLSLVSAIFSLLLVILIAFIKVLYWQSISPDLVLIFSALSLVNSITLGFLAILLDKTDSILATIATLAPSANVQHSKIYN